MARVPGELDPLEAAVFPTVTGKHRRKYSPTDPDPGPRARPPPPGPTAWFWHGPHAAQAPDSGARDRGGRGLPLRPARSPAAKAGLTAGSSESSWAGGAPTGTGTGRLRALAHSRAALMLLQNDQQRAPGLGGQDCPGFLSPRRTQAPPPGRTPGPGSRPRHRRLLGPTQPAPPKRGDPQNGPPVGKGWHCLPEERASWSLGQDKGHPRAHPLIKEKTIMKGPADVAQW